MVHACALHAGYLRLHTHTRTYLEYAILTAHPLQQCLQELASSIRTLPVLVTAHDREGREPSYATADQYEVSDYERLLAEVAHFVKTGI
jgi:hypothetical protein